ncbi:MAG: hypothetical protein N3A54_03015 [Patescibacteria group bacterium]|nr:hypothetical protein [Patescibacteria group bacterium]
MKKKKKIDVSFVPLEKKGDSEIVLPMGAEEIQKITKNSSLEAKIDSAIRDLHDYQLALQEDAKQEWE